MRTVRVAVPVALANAFNATRGAPCAQRLARCATAAPTIAVASATPVVCRALWALVVGAGVRQTDRLVVIADGAEWIDQTVDLLFYGATRILDFYHAAHRLYAVAAERWGEGAKAAQVWAMQQVEKLKGGGSRAVIAALKRLTISIEGWKVRQEAVAYLSRRVGQMGYQEYQEAGLPIGSGAIESSGKQIVTARCKQAGMRWSEAGSEAILALAVLW